MTDLIRQVIRFGMVGVLAAMVQLGVVIFFVQTFHIKPLIANIIGFLLAFQVSYWGHRTFTFHDTTVMHRVALPKLLFVQITSFIINEFLYYCLLNLQIPYVLALFIVLTVMPLFTFSLSRAWVF